MGSTLKVMAFVALAVVLLCSEFLFDVASYVSPEKITLWLEDAGFWAPFLYMLAMAVAIIVSPIPSLPLDMAAGAFFGPLAGTLYSSVGALLGALVAFSLARLLGREALSGKLKGHINFCTPCSNAVLTRIVFLSRLVPFISFDVVSYGAGLTRMSYGRFAVATFLGVLPLTFVYNYFGSVLVISGQVAVVAGLALVALFFLVPAWMERKSPLALERLFARTHGPAGKP